MSSPTAIVIWERRCRLLFSMGIIIKISVKQQFSCCCFGVIGEVSSMLLGVMDIDGCRKVLLIFSRMFVALLQN